MKPHRKSNSETEDGSSNALILECSNKSSKHSKKMKVKSKPNKSVTTLSKNQQRKLRRIQEEKEKQEKRATAIEILQKNRLNEEEHALLSSSGNIGKVETMKAKLSRAMLFHKAGLEVPSDVPLFRERESHSVAVEDEDLQENGSYSVAKGSLRIDNLQDLNKKHSKILDPVCKITTGNSELDESRAMNTSKIECHNVVPLEESISNSISKVDMESKNDKKKHDGDTARKGRLDNSKSEDSGKDEKLSITDKVSTVSDSASIHSVVGTKPGRKSGDLQNCDKDKKMLASRDANDQIMSSQGCLLRCTFVVPVSRPEEVEEKRKDLPIIMMEQEIMEAVNQHPIVIICGETGCGKTTQVPQFLFEAGFGSKACKERSGVIGITQPRRVAVLATAKRVAHEMSFQLGKEVGFQVRHDRRIGEKSSIKFMTDGILLREVQSDFLLRRYSIIVLDEAHERSLNTDILIGMLSRIVPYRQKLYNEQQEELSNGKLVAPDKLISPLKLILMSATLRIEDFVTNTKLFPTSPPVVEVPTRQFPVTIHFSAKTELVDYLGKAYKKVLAIHTKLPSGGILVFVTGQREVELLCRKLRKAFVKQRNKLANSDNSRKNGKPSSISDKGSDEANLEQIAQAVDETDGDSKCMDRFELYDDDGFDAPLETHSSSSSDDYSDSDFDSEEECLVMNTSFSDPGKLFGQTDLLKQPESLTSLKAAFQSLNQETDVKSKTESAEPIIQNLKNEKQKDLNSDSGPKVPGPLHVLPLYALLPAGSQLRVFSKIPEGERLVVVATNVAETSITIPGIKYVVDCGRAKVKEYNNKSGIARYEIQWISKASAAQRAGRAGRTGPGHCYRLYSSAVFNNTFMDFPVPEIVKAPIEGIILLLNNMNINKVTNFPFPTPPEGSAIKEGIKCLESLSALTQKGMMTPLGKAMVLFPISPRHSCMLLTTIRIVKGLRKCDGTNVVLAFAIAVAAALSMDNPFLTDFGSSSLKDVTENEIDRKMSEEENLNKKQRASARNTQRAFENASSDPLTVVNVLHSFEFAANKEEFCRVNYLHFKTMDEMSKLRKQLMHVVFHQKMDVECEQFNWSFGTLFDVERAWREHRGSLKLIHEDILRQAVCAGWVDRIAKRVKSNKISKVLPEDQRIKAIRYQSCSVDEIIYLHPSSSTAKAAPDFVVYNELVETKRLYMRGVTSVNKDWLVLHGKALCSFSKPLADPEPEYDSLLDEVFCWVSPTFGTRNWELPLHRAIIESTEERVRVFACALLQGKVLPCLNAIQRCLAADPVIIRKPESVVHKRVSELLYRLNSRPIAVDNRAKLRSVLGEDSKFLYSELLLWLQSNFRPIFDKLWEKVNLEIKLEHRELYPKRSKKSDSARDWY